MNLAQLFLDAVANGDLGCFDDNGVTLTFEQCRQSFPHIDAGEISDFLPRASGEQELVQGQPFLHHIQGDLYRIDADTIDAYLDNPEIYTTESPSARHS